MWEDSVSLKSWMLQQATVAKTAIWKGNLLIKYITNKNVSLVAHNIYKY